MKLAHLVIPALLSTCLVSTAAAEDRSGYWVNSEGTVWRSGFNLCWRAGYWTPALAIAECDPDLVAKPAVAEPTPEPVAAPAPGPMMEPPSVPEPMGPKKPAFEKFTFGAETLFAFDKADVRADAAHILDDIVDKMNRYPEVELIVVTGHTDRIGAEAYNQKLSDRRAAAVRDYLIGKGVDGGRVQSVGRGESEPVVGCGAIKGKANRANRALIECLQPNRRVVIEIAVQRETGGY
ncbi:MAG: OmpA family protein [Burkholderiales bacterium]|jgi:OOP family OmpA-OmpF porin